MKFYLTFLCLGLITSFSLAQAPVPPNLDSGRPAPAEIMPTPTPSGTPPPSVNPPTPTPSTESDAAETQQDESVTQSQTPEEIINSLNDSDLQKILSLLQTNYFNKKAISDIELKRATVEGLLKRLQPGMAIVSTERVTKELSGPFRAEILDDRIGYIRLGSLSKNNLSEMDAALGNFKSKGLRSTILDLRATPKSTDFEFCAEVIQRFCPKGKMLFTIRRPSVKQERIFTSNQDPKFNGLLMVLVDGDTAGAAEVIAAVLRFHTKCLVIGTKSAGETVEFADFPLQEGKILKLAVAELTLPENLSVFPEGVTPDLVVDLPPQTKRQIMKLSLRKGVSQFVFEEERLRNNEASLVAGTNPEADNYLAMQEEKDFEKKKKLQDTVIQRAVDLITAIQIYHKKPSEK